jgi:hypothetical protein
MTASLEHRDDSLPGLPGGKEILMRRSHVLIPAAALALAGMAAPAWAATDAATPKWQTVPSPHIPAGDNANLIGVSMSGPSNGWTVGFTVPPSDSPFTPFTARWNGHRWRTVAVPPGMGKNSRLNSVAALSPSNAWAVGDGTTPVILHWNGHRWAQMRSAHVPGVDVGSLLSVAARSPNDVWAVGQAENATTQHERPVIEHWDGHRWSLMASPGLGNFSFLTSVTIASDGSVWAAGTSDGRTGPFILRWTGRTWVKAAVPKTPGNVDIDLESITAVSPKQIWAVGEISVSNSPSRPYSLRWNGRTWNSVKMPDPSPATFIKTFSVTAFGHGQLAAVGSEAASTGSHAVYSRWNGHSWSVVVGSENGDDLNSVATDGKRLWAVGFTGDAAFLPFIQTSH